MQCIYIYGLSDNNGILEALNVLNVIEHIMLTVDGFFISRGP